MRKEGGRALPWGHKRGGGRGMLSMGLELKREGGAQQGMRSDW